MNELSILHQTSDFVAVAKPEGIATIPERDLAVQNIKSILEEQIKTQVLIVHRLDKEVSGVLLFALNAPAHKALCMDFESRKIKKQYYALVHGDVKNDIGEIAFKIRQFGSGRMGVDEAKGKPCLTKYTVISRSAKATLLAIEPASGRRHQIRVHLYALGHPIVGDSHYGDVALQKVFSRCMLHARKIEFLLNGHTHSIESLLPDSYKAILKDFGLGNL